MYGKQSNQFSNNSDTQKTTFAYNYTLKVETELSDSKR